MQALLCSRTLGGYRALSCFTVPGFDALSSPWSFNSKHPSLPAPSPIPEQISRSYRAPEPGQPARHATLPSVAVHEFTPGTRARLTQQVTQYVARTNT